MDAPAYRAKKILTNLFGVALLAIPAVFPAGRSEAQSEIIPESQLRYFAGLTLATNYGHL